MFLLLEFLFWVVAPNTGDEMQPPLLQTSAVPLGYIPNPFKTRTHHIAHTGLELVSTFPVSGIRGLHHPAQLHLQLLKRLFLPSSNYPLLLPHFPLNFSQKKGSATRGRSGTCVLMEHKFETESWAPHFSRCWR